MKNLVARLIHDDEGQDLIEYGLLIGIITTGVVAVVGDIGPLVKGYFDDLKTALDAEAGG